MFGNPKNVLDHLEGCSKSDDLLKQHVYFPHWPTAKAGFTRQICDLVVGRQLTAVDARHKLTRCLHDRHGQGQATSSDLDNRSLPLACLPLLAGTDRRRQTASKMAPVGDSSVLRKQMGLFVWWLALLPFVGGKSVEWKKVTGVWAGGKTMVGTESWPGCFHFGGRAAGGRSL